MFHCFLQDIWQWLLSQPERNIVQEILKRCERWEPDMQAQLKWAYHLWHTIGRYPRGDDVAVQAALWRLLNDQGRERTRRRKCFS